MILMNDFRSEPPELREAMLDAFRRVMESGWYVLGNEVISFEKQWASACGMAHAIGVGNGMDGIEIALRSLNIGPGDEVITTSMTAFATVLAILRAGATPVLADIDPDTALLSLESVRRCLSLKTKAVLLVHLYGQVSRMGDWTAFCADNRLHLIEDCAQAHLSCWEGKVAGSFGSAGIYSFYPTKNLGALGDAGALVTNDEQIAIRAVYLRNYGQSERYHHPYLGMNSRLDEIQAALLAERLNYLAEFTQRRIAIAATYRSAIVHPAIRQLAAPQELYSHVYHLYVLCCDRRDDLAAHMRASSIQTLVHYPIPIHEQEPCREFRFDPLGLRHSVRHAKTCLSIPCHPNMSDSDIDKVIRVINNFR